MRFTIQLVAEAGGADVARIFRVHRATISRIAAEARAMPPQGRRMKPSKS